MIRPTSPSGTTSAHEGDAEGTRRPEETVSLSAVDVISGVPSVEVNHGTSHLLMQSRDRSAARPLRVDRDSTIQAFRGPGPNGLWDRPAARRDLTIVLAISTQGQRGTL